MNKYREFDSRKKKYIIHPYFNFDFILISENG